MFPKLRRICDVFRGSTSARRRFRALASPPPLTQRLLAPARVVLLYVQQPHRYNLALTQDGALGQRGGVLRELVMTLIFYEYLLFRRLCANLVSIALTTQVVSFLIFTCS